MPHCWEPPSLFSVFLWNRRKPLKCSPWSDFILSVHCREEAYTAIRMFFGPPAFQELIENSVYPIVLCGHTWSMKWKPRRLGCQRVGMPGLGSRLSICCPTKRSKWRCSQHAYADQTPTPCVPVASPGLKPKGRVCMWKANAPALSNRASSTWLELQSL